MRLSLLMNPPRFSFSFTDPSPGSGDGDREVPAEDGRLGDGEFEAAVGALSGAPPAPGEEALEVDEAVVTLECAEEVWGPLRLLSDFSWRFCCPSLCIRCSHTTLRSWSSSIVMRWFGSGLSMARITSRNSSLSHGLCLMVPDIIRCSASMLIPSSIPNGPLPQIIVYRITPCNFVRERRCKTPPRGRKEVGGYTAGGRGEPVKREEEER